MTPLDWPDFYFARHGETDWNRERRYQGTKDIPLNATGRSQAGDNRWHFRPDQGESYDDVGVRLLDFARELTQHAVVVAHGGVLRVLRHLIEGVEREEAVNWPPPQGAIAHFVRGRMTLYSATNTWDSTD